MKKPGFKHTARKIWQQIESEGQCGEWFVLFHESCSMCKKKRSEGGEVIKSAGVWCHHIYLCQYMFTTICCELLWKIKKVFSSPLVDLFDMLTCHIVCLLLSDIFFIILGRVREDGYSINWGIITSGNMRKENKN